MNIPRQFTRTHSPLGYITRQAHSGGNTTNKDLDFFSLPQVRVQK